MQAVNAVTEIPVIRSTLREMLKQRVLTAIVALAVLAMVMFVVPAVVARIAITFLMLGAAWEWSGFIFSQENKRRFFYVLFIAILIAVIFFELPDARLVDIVFKISLAWWMAALAWMFFFPTPIAKSVAWICGALVIVPAWLALDLLYLQTPELLLFALLIVWVADIGAYFVGKGFGRVKLAPQISPVPFCVAVAMISIVGDLAVSMFKRNAGVKDSGSLFPGHGGVLDRIDSVTAAAPLFAVALGWIGMR